MLYSILQSYDKTSDVLHVALAFRTYLCAKIFDGGFCIRFCKK